MFAEVAHIRQRKTLTIGLSDATLQQHHVSLNPFPRTKSPKSVR